MLVLKLRPEKKSKRDVLLRRRNVTDTPKRRIAMRIGDGVIIEELI